MRKDGRKKELALRELCLLGSGWELPEGYEAGLLAGGVALRRENAWEKTKNAFVSEEWDDCLFLTRDAALCRKLQEEGLAAVLAVEEAELEAVPWDIVQVVTEPFSLTARELCWLFQRQKGLPLVIAETERLLVRETVPEDLEALRNLYREEEKNSYIFPLFGGRIGEEGLADYRRAQYKFYGFGMWSLCLRETGEVIGRLGFECGDEPGVLELGYLLAARFRKQGYAREAAVRLLSLAKEQSWGSRVRIRTGRGMAASRRLAAALGFSLYEEAGETCTYEKSLE